MKNVIAWMMLMMSAFLLVGCSSNLKYITTPTPLQKESSQYYVKDSLVPTLLSGNAYSRQFKE